LRRIIKAFEKQSVARKLPMETVVIFTQERAGGYWVPVAEVKHEVSGEAPLRWQQSLQISNKKKK
jgi:uncharacterized protein (DUF2235 family)